MLRCTRIIDDSLGADRREAQVREAKTGVNLLTRMTLFARPVPVKTVA